MQRYWKWVAIALAVVLLLPSGALAQTGATGAITGVVQDEKGGVIPKAKVTIINVATGAKVREVETGDAGTFAVPLLPPGTYKVEITASGFSKFVGENIAVRVTETTTILANMKVGAVTETITVTDAATVVNVANATTGQTIGAHTVSSLPLSTGNFLTLLTLSAGANTEIFDSAALGRGQVTINVNGQRPVNNNYQLEGINANDINLPILDNVALPNPQTVQEFKTQTSMYDASQGRNGGGNIQVALKSGGNEYHGAAAFFYRDDALNANSWFFNRDGQSRPILQQKQVNGSFGGPVPLIKDMFFFLNYQRSRATSGSAAFTFFTSNIPVLPSVRTAASLTTTFFPFGLPTGTSINAQALAFLNLPASKCPEFADSSFCIPTLSGTAGINIPAEGTITLNLASLSRSGAGTGSDDQYVVSIDKQLTSKDKITGRWFFSNNNTLQPFGIASTLPFAKGLPGSNRFLKLGWTRVFTNSTVNDFRFGFNRFTFAQAPSEPILLTDIGATRGNSAQYPAAYRIAITGAFSLGTGVNDQRGGGFNTFVYGDDFTWTKGRHIFRFGMEASRYQLNRFNNFATRGSVAFGAGVAGDGGGLYGSLNPNGFQNLAGFQNFLLGRVTGTQGRSGFSTFYFRAADYAAYVQDDWKIHPHVTLNLGLRWEGLSIANEEQNFLTNYLGLGDNTPGPVKVIHPSATPIVGTPGVSRCTMLKCFDDNNYGPRVGLAWDIFGDQSTVLRSGYGVYFQRTSNQPLLQTSGGSPFSQDFSATRFGVTMANPFPSSRPDSDFPLPFDEVTPALVGFNGTTGAPIFASASGNPISGFKFYPSRDFHAPYAQQWNLTIQRSLFKGWMLEVGYVGTRGVELIGTGRSLNPSKICTAAAPCVIPASMGLGISVPAGTPFVTKSTDGTIQITGSTFANRNARVATNFLGLANNRGFFQVQDGTSSYHSLQSTLSHRWSNGLYFQGAYTYARSIDNSSGSAFGDELNGLLHFCDMQQTRCNRGPSDFDRTHRLVFSYNYELPFGKWSGLSNSGFLGRLVNGWAINGVTTFQSGTPFVVYDSGALSLQDLEGNNGAYPATLASGATLSSVLTSGSLGSRATNGFVDFSQFVSGGNCVNNQNVGVPCQIPNTLPPPAPRLIANPDAVAAAFGNVGRNTFRGPFQQNWDMSIVKSTKITERYSFDFRTDFFNIWNHPAFQSPQAGGGSFGNYGLVDVAVGDSTALNTVTRPRIIQFAFLFRF